MPPPPAVAHELSPRKNVELSAVPLPNRAVATVPDERLLAFSVVRLAPERLSMMVELNGPSILPSVPTKETFPVPILSPPPTSNALAPVPLTVSPVN